jgi:hypothetical protein
LGSALGAREIAELDLLVNNAGRRRSLKGGGIKIKIFLPIAQEFVRDAVLQSAWPTAGIGSRHVSSGHARIVHFGGVG